MTKSEPVKYNPSLALVFGYLKGIDKTPETARDHELMERFSVALDTYHPLKHDTYFDVEVFENIFKTVLSHVPHDHVEIEFEKNERNGFSSFSDAITLIKNKNAVENDPCKRMFIYQNKYLVFYMETEYYTAVGGPAPYHDTYNFACFATRMNQGELEKAIIKTCQVHNFVIRTIETGYTLPVKTTLWERIKKVFLNCMALNSVHFF